nr:MFS transporter [Streptococcus pyogenes]
MFDFANNTFLAGLNPASLSLVAVYQSLESVIGVLFNLFGRVIADSFKRKKIIITTNILCGTACLVLSFLTKEQWLVYAIVLTNVILAFMSAFSSPSYKAFTKEIVKKDSISQLNSLLETTSTVIKVTVPMVAIFLYKLLGIHGVLLLDGLSFLIAALLISFILPVNDEVVIKEKVTIREIFNDLKIGFKYVYSHKSIFIITVLSALVNFFLAAYNLLLPYSNQMFGEISAGLYGTFLTAEAIGGFIGAILSGFVNKELSSMRLILFLSLSGLMLMLAPPFYIMFHNAIILALSPALFSLFLSIFNIQFFSLVQKDVDNDFLGRVFGIIFTITILFMPIGTGFFSVALNPNNSFNLFIIGSCITILSLVFRILFKKYNIR